MQKLAIFNGKHICDLVVLREQRQHLPSKVKAVQYIILNQ